MAPAPSSAELDIEPGVFLEALDAAGIGLHIVRHTTDGPERVYLNDSAASLLGHTLAEVYGHPPFAFIAPEERATIAQLERAQQRGQPLPDPLETVIQRPDGSRVRVEVHLARVELGHGTGLGLAISRSIVESMGGEIAAENRPEGGLIVRLSLPAEPPRAPAPADESSRAPARVTGQRRASVLVVDDEPLVARALAHLLGKHGFEVQSLVDPRDALERLRRDELFDLVFCDINMPRLTGADVYVAATDAHPEYATRFIFITGGAMTDRAARIIAEAAVPVVEKPFTAQEIVRVARTLIGPAD
ncbi:MAG TPA: response regulator [Kofleriaceae bacterium]|nr:response regulator [Kofleriaceae bacterium]